MRLDRKTLIIGAGGSSTAAGVSFDNSGVSLAATNVQDAIVEISAATGGASSRVDPDISTLTELAAVATTGLTVPVVRIIYNTDDVEVQTWVLLAGTDATSAGVAQRPNDYATTTNEKVWYRF